MSKIVICNDFADISNCKVVIEAIKEDSGAKKSLFESISKFISNDCLVATNTSSISITELSLSVPYPEMFIGMHFFNPPSVLKLIEVVKGLLTTDLAIEYGLDFVDKINKEAVLVKDSPGFIVNRMLVPMINEAICMVSENIASKQNIDKAMKLGANHPLGPLALADLIGLDVCLSIMDTLHTEFGDQKFRASPLLRQYVSAGMLGRKTKLGFYKY
jgi:3-hydroxybutyryl-CoA dehydrogenase